MGLSLYMQAHPLDRAAPHAEAAAALERMRAELEADLAALVWSGETFALPRALDGDGKLFVSVKYDVKSDDTADIAEREADQILAIAEKLSRLEPGWVFSVSDDVGVVSGTIHLRDGIARKAATRTSRPDEEAGERVVLALMAVTLTALKTPPAPAAAKASAKKASRAAPATALDPELDAHRAAFDALARGEPYPLIDAVAAAATALRDKLHRAALARRDKALWSTTYSSHTSVFVPPLSRDVVRGLAAMLLDTRATKVRTPERKGAADLLGRLRDDDLALRALVTRSHRDRGYRDDPEIQPEGSTAELRPWRAEVFNALCELHRPDAFPSVALDALDRGMVSPLGGLLAADPARTLALLERDWDWLCDLEPLAHELSYERIPALGRELATPHLRRLLAHPLLHVRAHAAKTLATWHDLAERPMIVAMIALLTSFENVLDMESRSALGSLKGLEYDFARKHGPVAPAALAPLPTSLDNVTSPIPWVRTAAWSSRLDTTLSEHPHAKALALGAEAAWATRTGLRRVLSGYDRLAVADIPARIEELRRRRRNDPDRPLTPALAELARVGPEAFTADWAAPGPLNLSADERAALADEERRLLLSDRELAALVLPF